MRSVSTYPAGTGTRRPPGLPSISSSSSELSGVGLGTPILRRRLWGGSGGRRGLWGTRAAGGTCPSGGQKAEQRSVGAQSPDEREPPTPRPPLLFSSSRRSSRPPQLRDHSRRAPPPGHAHTPAPPPPRPWPPQRPDFDPDGGSASGRRLGELAAPGFFYPHPPSLRAHPALHLPAFPGESVLARPLGMMG